VLAGNIDGARLQVIVGSGHIPPLEQPRAFNQALLGWLRDLTAQEKRWKQG
jgi:pimeloyl-ACP methyl ester carboxylesterase